MIKELVTIEFRYRDKPINKDFSGSKTSKITIGVYDTFKEAIEAGNKALENLESRFKLHKFPQGNNASKERFGEKNGCFGTQKRLITNLAYLQTPFEFYAKITKLEHIDLNSKIDDVLESLNRWRKFKKEENDKEFI